MQFTRLSASTLIRETVITRLILKYGLPSPVLQGKLSAPHNTSWSGLEETTSMKQRGPEGL